MFCPSSPCLALTNFTKLTTHLQSHTDVTPFRFAEANSNSDRSYNKGHQALWGASQEGAAGPQGRITLRCCGRPGTSHVCAAPCFAEGGPPSP